MRTALLALLALGCTGADPEADTAPTVDTEDTDIGPVGPTGQLGGRILDPSGAGIPGVFVNLCKSVCTTEETDASGAFQFDPLGVGTYSFHVEPLESMSWGEPLVPYTLEEGADDSVDVTLPKRSAAVALPASRGWIDLGQGLSLEVGQGELTKSFADDPTEVAVARPAPSTYLPLEGLPGTALAMWYLYPYEAEADPASGVRLANDLALPSGGVYELWAASYWDYAFVKLGTLTVTEDGQRLEGAIALATYTTLALVEPAR